jgi:hypothetical protein
MYSTGYDQSTQRSPIAQRNQPQANTLNRMPSRQFDAYGQVSQANMYAQDDHQRNYEQPRNYEQRLNQTIHGAGYGYDMGAPAAWNANAFSQNGLGSLGGANAARVRSQQQQRGGGRSALPQVSTSLMSHAYIKLPY